MTDLVTAAGLKTDPNVMAWYIWAGEGSSLSETVNAVGRPEIARTTQIEAALRIHDRMGGQGVDWAGVQPRFLGCESVERGAVAVACTKFLQKERAAVPAMKDRVRIVRHGTWLPIYTFVINGSRAQLEPALSQVHDRCGRATRSRGG